MIHVKHKDVVEDHGDYVGRHRLDRGWYSRYIRPQHAVIKLNLRGGAFK